MDTNLGLLGLTLGCALVAWAVLPIRVRGSVVLFVIAASVAGWGAAFQRSYSNDQRSFGLILLVVGGLAAVTLPIVWSIYQLGGESPRGESPPPE